MNMKTKLFAAPWGMPNLTKEIEEAIEIIGDDLWKNASISFYSARDSKLRSGKSAPKGMQRYLNELLEQNFLKNGWEGGAGYYFKNKTWIRITFRHQMSLGSDIIDAIKVCKKEGMEIAAILAANRNTLDLISPNDAAALVSFEKLQKEIIDLNGAIDIPILIGELTPITSASDDINEELRKERKRDRSIPDE